MGQEHAIRIEKLKFQDVFDRIAPGLMRKLRKYMLGKDTEQFCSLLNLNVWYWILDPCFVSFFLPPYLMKYESFSKIQSCNALLLETLWPFFGAYRLKYKWLTWPARPSLAWLPPAIPSPICYCLFHTLLEATTQPHQTASKAWKLQSFMLSHFAYSEPFGCDILFIIHLSPSHTTLFPMFIFQNSDQESPICL